MPQGHTGGGTTTGATVAVVDDEPDVVELYAHYLSTEYEVRSAVGGEEALEVIDGAVDVVFLDRRMPDYTGGEVLERLEKPNIDVRTVMVTAVQPDFDIVEMPFDDYLIKPVSGEELIETTERMMVRDDYADAVREYYALAEKRATLQAEKSEPELESSERYRALLEELERARQQADQQLSSLSDDTQEEVLLDL